jgi:hypothetical protein
MTTSITWGSEFPVNLTAEGDQRRPDIVALAGGRFVAVWEDTGDGNGVNVRAQMFNADGSRFGGEFVVNTVPSGKYDAAVTALSDGRFVVSWYDANTGGGADTSGGSVKARIFDATGARLGGEFLVNTTTANGQQAPAITALADGKFAIAWTDYSGTGDTAPAGIRTQVFDANGNKTGGEILANSTTPRLQNEAAIAALANGTIVVAWSDDSRTGADISDGAVRARLFGAGGTPLAADFVVNATTQGLQFRPDITALADGRFVVAWTDLSETGADTSFYAARAQMFNADGSRSGSEFLVNTTTAGSQVNPVIAALSDGRFVAAWQSTVGPAKSDVRVQVFKADGTRDGGEISLDRPDSITQFSPTITTLPDGRLVVSFEDGSDIHARILDPRHEGVTLAGTPLDDQYVGTGFADFLKGDAGGDRLAGEDGNDTLVGGPGVNQLRGGAGDDTAVFSQNLDRYDIYDWGTSIVAFSLDSDDTLTGIEHLQFRDGRIDVNDGSALFDTIYYAHENSDVYAAGVNARGHYDAFGWHEGRDPNDFFDTKGYLAANPDVAAAGVNPLDHYHQSGWHERRDPSQWFDTTLYLIHNPDVAAAGIDPLEHYLAFGIAEGRALYAAVGPAIQGFDAQYYLFHNPDVATAGVDPLLHFNTHGWREGRDPNAWFDTAGYLTHYADVAAADINPLWHYETQGWREGRDPSAGFDTLGYLTANPDVAAAHINPLDHFLQFGVYEGRQVVSDGMWS